jgi:hypothetical protein
MIRYVLAVGVLLLASTAHADCPKTGRYAVTIDSAPPGAPIYVGDKSCQLGVTPWSGKLNAGDYTIIIDTPGYEPQTKQFHVGRLRATQQLFVPLVKKADPPKIDVRADADKNVYGAAVFLDGQPQGQAPMILSTTEGRHQVRLQKDGFEPLETWVDCKNNQTSTFAPTIKEIAKPKFGDVIVDADVKDAEVYIDGNKHPDNTPAVIRNVIEGLHVIEVRKAPALPWKQTIEVKAGQQTKVTADLNASLNGGVGVVRVLSDAPGARAFIDGTDMGPVPVDIKDVRAGDHIVQVKAPNMQTGEKHVMVQAGQSQIVKFDLNTEASGETGLLKVVSTVPEALVYVDGAALGKVPQEKKVSTGEHPVVVRLEGYKQFEQKVRVEAGQSVTVQADLRAVGRLRVLTTPSKATVLINGMPSGQTPITDLEVETGETVIRVELAGFQPWEQTLNVEGGKTQTISKELAVAGPSQAELAAEQRGRSSFGARTLPKLASTADLDVGYPYYFEGRVTVGAGRIAKQFGFDANVGVRSLLARTEIGIGARAMLANAEPFSAGAFSDLWWGSKLLDNSGRNGLTWNVGVVASLTAVEHVTISGRAYLDIWSDRHCPGSNGTTPDYTMNGGFEANTDPIGVCKEWLGSNGNNGVGSMPNTPEYKRLHDLVGWTHPQDAFDREQGVRGMLSIAAEIAIQQQWNVFFVLEGAPFQSQRALFTNDFAHSMFDTDFDLYGRVGLTFKF